MNLDQIGKEGYYLKETKSNIGNMALVSLRTALKAYFATYQCNQFNLRELDESKKMRGDEAEVSYPIKYSEHACAAITNFQHFTELILKDILRREHPLLSVDAYDKPDILFDLLRGGAPSEGTLEKLKQVEASVALSRVCSLIESGRVDKAKYEFITHCRKFLELLNKLRNRILHRGIFVLKYNALDWLFGRHALPFLEKVISLPEYNTYSIWKFRPLHCSINPIDEIILSFEKSKYH